MKSELSKPIGKSDQPDSPIIDKEGYEDPPEKDTASATCIYKSEEYSVGSRVCQEGRIHVCTSSGWSRHNENC